MSYKRVSIHCLAKMCLLKVVIPLATLRCSLFTAMLVQASEITRENPAAEVALEAKGEMEALWRNCTINPQDMQKVKEIAGRIVESRSRYEKVSKSTHVPWEVIGVIHFLEGNADFTKHLRSGRQVAGHTDDTPSTHTMKHAAKFVWEEAAVDTLISSRLAGWSDWSTGGILCALEYYNGQGYRDRGINSPYIWACTNHYEKGMYKTDGDFDSDAVQEKPGAAALLKQIYANAAATRVR